MFRCELTGELSAASEKPLMIVVERRRKEYYGWRKRREKDERPFWDKLGEGYETVRELRIRQSNLEKWDGKVEEQKGNHGYDAQEHQPRLRY